MMAGFQMRLETVPHTGVAAATQGRPYLLETMTPIIVPNLEQRSEARGGLILM